MKEISLTQGKFAMVDDEDYPLLSRFAWQFGIIDKAQYAYVVIQGYGERSAGRHFLMHQMIIPAANGKYLHHRDGNSLNNQKSNLVLVSNNFRRHLAKKHKNGTSKYRGVWFNKRENYWRASISFEHKQMIVYQKSQTEGGNERDAARAYDKKARELYGEFAYQNKIS